VAEASGEPPKFIHLTYTPPGGVTDTTTKLAIVGKGLTFDSGGYKRWPACGAPPACAPNQGGAIVVHGVIRGSETLAQVDLD